jgi:hypothetical protein
MAETRSATGVEELAVEASRNSTRRKLHPLKVEEKAEKARAEVERHSVVGAELPAAQGVRLSQRRKTNPLTVEQKAEKAVADATRYRQFRLIVKHKAEKLELIPKNGMRKVHKL